MPKPVETLTTDVLIIGGGGAGLRAAVESQRYGARTLIVDKAVVGWNNNTVLAGGGVKGALKGMLDETIEKQYSTPEEHFEDTIRYGQFLNDQQLVEILAVEAPARILELGGFGVTDFHALCNLGNPAKGGSAITEGLSRAYKQLGGKSLHATVIVDLLMGADRVVGAIGYRILQRRFVRILAKSTIVAAGGTGELFERNYTVGTTTGDGYALAARVGAPLMDMEFVQFSPYVAAEPNLPMWYVMPCKARMLGVLRNAKGESFIENYLKPVGGEGRPFPERFGALPTDIREIIAWAICMEVHEGRGHDGGVFLDLSHVPDEAWEEDRPGQFNRHRLFHGFDFKKPIHVIPGVITHLGGIRINERTETAIPGLYAAGEVAGGVHGARRRGGNAISDCLVFGARAGKYGALAARELGVIPEPVSAEGQAVAEEWLARRPTVDGSPQAFKQRIKKIMWTHVGPLRSATTLGKAREEMIALAKAAAAELSASDPFALQYALEVRHMLETGRQIIDSALERHESRGDHYRLDFPDHGGAQWLFNVELTGDADRRVIRHTPVNMVRLRPADREPAGHGYYL
jgi:fumarate reductase (CoM/CoB) subunit A